MIFHVCGLLRVDGLSGMAVRIEKDERRCLASDEANVSYEIGTSRQSAFLTIHQTNLVCSNIEQVADSITVP